MLCGQVAISDFGLRGVAMLLKRDVELAVSLDKRLVIAVKAVSITSLYRYLV